MTQENLNPGWSEADYVRRLMQRGGLRRFPRTIRYHTRHLGNIIEDEVTTRHTEDPFAPSAPFVSSKY